MRLCLRGSTISLFYAALMNKFQLCIVTLLACAVSVWAAPTGPARIQGVVKDSKGQSVAGAEVHIKAKDGSGLEKIARTDSDGNFGIGGLPTTQYEVILFVNGQIKASLTNQHVFSDKPTKVDFKLTGKYVANNQKKKTHMVYVPAETGSNLSGRWVEVDDVTGAGAATTNNTRTLSGEAVRKMQTGGYTGGR